jgi:hypothetical protein
LILVRIKGGGISDDEIRLFILLPDWTHESGENSSRALQLNMNSITKSLTIILILVLASGVVQSQTHNSQYTQFQRTRNPFVERRRRIAPVRISPARLLVVAGDTLSMLDDKRQVLWRWAAGNGEEIMARPFVDSHDNIFLIADDGLILSLDLSGKVRWRHKMTGTFVFTQLRPYQHDQFLVVINASSRGEGRGLNEDGFLSLYQDEEVLGSVAFPRNALLYVRGKRIYAVMNNRRGMGIKEIKFPKKA